MVSIFSFCAIPCRFVTLLLFYFVTLLLVTLLPCYRSSILRFVRRDGLHFAFTPCFVPSVNSVAESLVLNLS